MSSNNMYYHIHCICSQFSTIINNYYGLQLSTIIYDIRLLSCNKTCKYAKLNDMQLLYKIINNSFYYVITLKTISYVGRKIKHFSV